MQPTKRYAELHCLSNFTFLRGASRACELVERAVALNYDALAITDECSIAGIVRAHEAAAKQGLKLIVGTEIHLDDGPSCVLLAPNHQGYSELCELITMGRRAATKGTYHLTRADLADLSSQTLALWLPGSAPDPNHGSWLQTHFEERCWLAIESHLGPNDCGNTAYLLDLAQSLNMRAVAAGNVHMHCRSRRPLQDTLTAIRLRTPIRHLGHNLHANGERHLRSLRQLQWLHPPELLEESVKIADRINFSLADLNYEYPEELVPTGRSSTQYLRELTETGITQRWPRKVSPDVRQQIEHELALIAELEYEPYFLTVHDIVRFAREQNILCQGRGSAANSAVCFCLGITEVDPSRMNMLFERFISKERNEPPDIDVDFEHSRREEVLQYVFNKYGRHRAAIAATVITYRAKSAVRDVGKALGLDLEQVDRLAKALSRWDSHEMLNERLTERGFDPDSKLIRQLLVLVDQLIGFPRHLSQHVGGFVISQHPLSQLVPVENAAMADRTIIQWDKDDLETLGLLKVDCLALGMLTAIHRGFDLMADFYGRHFDLASVPAEDPDVYRMIQKADTVGVFQIESRAQMSMLPRLKPACYYDLVVEVAIVRPGPIQGKMVHPYLRRRQGLEPVTYPSPALRKVFERTLGVPIFQEQVMQLAVVAAGFTPGEADELRRSMAAWKRRGNMSYFRDRILNGMRERGYDESFALQVFQQIKGFGSYGFPESHAASFALLVYISCWMKHYYPAAFCCALLNSQPMGFYQPAQLIQDAQRHGVTIYPPDICYSLWDSHLVPEKAKKGSDPFSGPKAAIRLGLRQIKGMRETTAQRLVAARINRPFSHVEDLVRRAELDKHDQTCLADGDALQTLTGHRHQARWAIDGVESLPPLLATATIADPPVQLRTPSEAADVLSDYRTLGLTLRSHPVALVRTTLKRRGVSTAAQVLAQTHGTRARGAGLVTMRQRPGTAAGVTFLTLEDETGLINVIVWQDLGERQRRELLESELMIVDGVVEKAQSVCHLIAHNLHNGDDLVGQLHIKARNFC